jgi:DNA-binding NarL/FixJ family response regulator
MASIPVSTEQNVGRPPDGGVDAKFLRVILADTQAIFRAGLRKIFAVEDDIRVVGQAETLPQTMSAAKKFSSDVLMFEASLAPNPVEAVADLLKLGLSCKLVVLIQEPNQELTLELFRRGAHGIISREVEPEILVECLRTVARGEPWLERQAVNWVLEAYRTQGGRPAAAKTKVQLTPKESLIVSCVTQGMKNKEIALRVGTTEQVVKNYLRKVYDKLGVADRLELALYCLHHRVVNNEAQAAANGEQAVVTGKADNVPAVKSESATAGPPAVVATPGTTDRSNHS